MGDPDGFRKDTEDLRRKLRLQQVRALSANIAKQVRNNVEEEKERQFGKFKAIRASKLEMWRQNISSEQGKDLRSAIFHLGTAHRAACAESNKKVENLIRPLKETTPVRSDIKAPCSLKHADAGSYCDITPCSYLYQKSNKQNFKCKSRESSVSSMCSTSSLSDLDNITLLEQKEKAKKQSPEQPESGSSSSDVEEEQKELKVCITQTPKKIIKNVAHMKELKSTMKKQIVSPSKFPVTKRRFTQVSDKIRQQKFSQAELHQQTATNMLDQFEAKSNLKCAQPISKKRPTKTLSKYQTSFRSFSTQTSGTLGKPNSSKHSQQDSIAKVQFYDYNNKFQKQYEQPPSLVTVHEPLIGEANVNVSEQAKLAEMQRDAKKLEIEQLRHKSNERCQRATEREQVKRACESLTAKLDAIIKHQVIPSDNHQFSSVLNGQMAAERAVELETAIPDILMRSTVITCPVDNQIDAKPNISAKNGSTSNSYGLNLELALTRSEISGVNSSDSCCSILLGFVNGQSKKVASDIKKCNEQNGEVFKNRSQKLKNLLTRINHLRQCLLIELKKSSTATFDNRHVQNMMDSINGLRKEHENIFIDSYLKDFILKREKNLKRKEDVLERKISSFFEMQKMSKKSGNGKHLRNQMQVAYIENSPSNQEKLNNSEQKTDTCSNKNNREEQVNERQVHTELEKHENRISGLQEEFEEQNRFNMRKKPLKKSENVKKGLRATKYKRQNLKCPNKLSTFIQRPIITEGETNLASARLSETSSTSYKSLPSTIQTNMNKLLKVEPVGKLITITLENQHKEQIEKSKPKRQNSGLNPLMAHYVQRLLGMSRKSIQALEVTSSDIETPGSSVINTTENFSAEDRLTLNQVQQFIKDNYSFIGELEESPCSSGSADSRLSAIEIIWKTSLREQNIKNKPNKQCLENENEYSKSIKIQKPTPILQEKASLKKTSESADTCAQRIAELTEMIKKVRKEKQKILESTLSSVSENERNSTEYLDLPYLGNTSGESSNKFLASTSTKSVENLLDQPSQNLPQLIKNKLTGMSRDSGISLSRPITVQEPHDYTGDISQVQISTPPILITRYSPQVENIPHELSTIFEVDTPATSRVNLLTQESNIKNVDESMLQEVRVKEITYRKFLTFEEYIKLNQLDISQFDPEFSTELEKEYNDYVNFVKEGRATGYKGFTSFNKYLEKSSSADDREAAEEMLASLKLANLTFKKFPTSKEYLDKIGISTSELLDSGSLDNVANSQILKPNNSSSESLFNIEEELKLRKILTKPFQQDLLFQDKVTNSMSSQNSELPCAKKTSYECETVGIDQMTESYPARNNESDDFENDVQCLYLQWPSAMKKKPIETQAVSSNTISSFGTEQEIKPSMQGKVVDNNLYRKLHSVHEETEVGGRQLDLREFITKELVKHAITSSSLSFSNDSLVSSIFRSIIDSITPSPQDQTNTGGPNLNRQKTSTPMASYSTISERAENRSHGGILLGQLFSGESRLSSVHCSRTSKDLGRFNRNDLDSKSNNEL